MYFEIKCVMSEQGIVALVLSLNKFINFLSKVTKDSTNVQATELKGTELVSNTDSKQKQVDLCLANSH